MENGLFRPSLTLSKRERGTKKSQITTNAKGHQCSRRAAQLHEGGAHRGGHEAAALPVSTATGSYRTALRRSHVTGIFSRPGNAGGRLLSGRRIGEPRGTD